MLSFTIIFSAKAERRNVGVGVLHALLLSINQRGWGLAPAFVSDIQQMNFDDFGEHSSCSCVETCLKNAFGTI